jgi:putative ABC transport system permease protein
MGIIALKMLFNDRAKYLGLIFGIVFATLLMSQQVSIFIGLMARAANQVSDIHQADIWVMDPQVTYIDEINPMADKELMRVRSVVGVKWAVPLNKSLSIIRALDGKIEQSILIGVDDGSLIGNPPAMVMGKWQDIKNPNAIIIDKAGYQFIWPNEEVKIGKVIEINDKRMEIVGICDASPPFLTFPIVYTRYSVASQLMSGNKTMSFILVKANDNQDLEQLTHRISAQTKLKALTSKEFQHNSINHYLKRTGIPINFGITVLLGFIVGAAIAGQTFYLFVIENLKQFAALKAIGVTNGQILKMVLLQALVVGAIGYSIGIGLCSTFFEITRDVPALKGFMLYWQVALGTFAAVCLIIILSSLVSIRKVLVIDPGIVFRG